MRTSLVKRNGATVFVVSEPLIRNYRARERDRLREIMIAAKAHWGYDIAWVRSWVESGAFSVPAASDSEVLVADIEGRVAGWAQLVPRDDVGWLEDLWVDPTSMGMGIGRALFARSVVHARELGLRRLEWEAEPRSVGFYTRMGGRYLRDSATVEWGRVLPIMCLDLTASEGVYPFEGAA
jgi:GNAT superfamily N-acetyltransferase